MHLALQKKYFGNVSSERVCGTGQNLIHYASWLRTIQYKRKKKKKEQGK